MLHPTTNEPYRKPRSSYTRRSAIRFLPILNELVNQCNEDTPRGMFINIAQFNMQSTGSLNNKFVDALLWLRHNANNLSGNVNAKTLVVYTQDDYEVLAHSLHKTLTATGITCHVIPKLKVENMLRDVVSLTTITDIKVELVKFLENEVDTPAKVFENVKFQDADLIWLSEMSGKMGFDYIVSGDRLSVVRK